MSAFRLATVERLREHQLQLCAQQLHAATVELTRAHAIRDGMVARLAIGNPVGSATPDQLAQSSMYRDRLRGDLLEQAEVIAALAAVLAERRAAWLHAHAQYRAITALHEHHRIARRAAIARQEQIELDELAGTRRPSIGVSAVEEDLEADGVLEATS